MLLGLSLSFLGCQKAQLPGVFTSPSGQDLTTGGKTEKSQKDLLNHTVEFKNVATGVHGAAYLAVRNACFQCHSQTQPTTMLGSKVFKNCSACHDSFPHPEGFALSTKHPEAFLAKDSKCMTCHKEGLANADAERSIPKCNTCHSEYPHGWDFHKPENHGAMFMKEGTSATCLNCHKEQPQMIAGRYIPSCTSCHKSFPHKSGFDDPEQHAPAYAQNSQSCISCHTRAGTQAPACTDCHQDFPHPSKFYKPEAHGAKFLAANGSATCQDCHQEKPQQIGDLYIPSCTSCHKNFPHTEGFNSPDKHGATYLATRACGTCHRDRSAEPVNSGIPACTDCHANFPHVSGFDDPEKHAMAFSDNSKLCIECHTRAGTQAPSCSTCHESPFGQ